MGKIAQAPEKGENAISKVDDFYKGNEMWATSGDSYFPCSSTEKILDPGQYIINFSENKGIFFTKKTINIDDFLSDELTGFKIKGKNVYFSGTCPQCLEDKKERK